MRGIGKIPKVPRIRTGGIAYVADLGDDIDDMIAILALRWLGFLGCVVVPPGRSDATVRSRIESLLADGIAVAEEIPQGTDVIISGGALTPVARLLRDGGRIGCLVANGGFAGDNVVAPDQRLRKFRGRNTVREYNFGLDVASTDFVLKSNRIDRIFLVGKNVCHSPENTAMGIWRESEDFLSQFPIRLGKRLHDLLAACEGLALAGLSDIPLSCEYRDVYPFSTGISGDRTEWGSSYEPTEYRMVTAAVGWASTSPRRDFASRPISDMP